MFILTKIGPEWYFYLADFEYNLKNDPLFADDYHDKVIYFQLKEII